MRRIVALIFAMLVSAAVVRGADNIETTADVARSVIDRVTEPSADVAAMRRYADCPVSYAMGSASFSIPLASLSTPTCGVSLALSYRCDAKKVDEAAGIVGLGWTMTGLGSVSRQICGLPDEKPEHRPYEKTAAYYNDLLTHKADANPDRYTVVTPSGESVSFIMKWKKANNEYDIIYLGESELEVKRHPDTNSRFTKAFTVTTPDGFKYNYAEHEKVIYDFKALNTERPTDNVYYEAVVAWHLTDIIAPEGSDTIVVEYETPKSFNISHSQNLEVENARWDIYGW